MGPTITGRAPMPGQHLGGVGAAAFCIGAIGHNGPYADPADRSRKACKSACMLAHSRGVRVMGRNEVAPLPSLEPVRYGNLTYGPADEIEAIMRDSTREKCSQGTRSK